MTMFIILSCCFMVVTFLSGINFALNGTMTQRIAAFLTVVWIGLLVTAIFLPTWGLFFWFLGVVLVSCVVIGPIGHGIGKRIAG